MQSYLFIGGGNDGLRIPLADEPDTIQLPAGATEKETYVRETLSVGDASICIYRHESLTPKQVLNLLIESYKSMGREPARRSPLKQQSRVSHC